MKLVLLVIVKWLKIDDYKREMITVTTSEQLVFKRLIFLIRDKNNRFF